MGRTPQQLSESAVHTGDTAGDIHAVLMAGLPCEYSDVIPLGLAFEFRMTRANGRTYTVRIEEYDPYPAGTRIYVDNRRIATIRLAIWRPHTAHWEMRTDLGTYRIIAPTIAD